MAHPPSMLHIINLSRENYDSLLKLGQGHNKTHSAGRGDDEERRTILKLAACGLPAHFAEHRLRVGVRR